MDEQNKTKPVVSNSDVTVKKKSKTENFISNFISDLVVNVVVPAMERMAANLVSDTFDATKRAFLSSMKFDTKTTTNASAGNKPGYISYNDYYNRFNNGGPSTFTPTVGDYAYNDVIFESRGKAEIVRSMLIDIIKTRKVVTVGDYYALCDIPTAPTDFNFGWTSLDSVQIHGYPNGFKIKLPRAMPIDR